jgi:hypothetical protein
VGDFDHAGAWEADAASSMTAWLRHHGRMSGGAAAAMVRTAKRLRQAPATAGAWQAGVLSGGQVQAVVANVDDRAAEVFAEHEAELVPALAPLSVRDTALAMQAWRVRAEALLGDDGEPDEAPRSLHCSKTLDGRRELKGSFDAEAGEVVATALRLAASPDAEGEPARPPAQRRADALVDLCRFFLDHQDDAPERRHRPHLNVVIDYDDLLARRPGRLVDDGLVDAVAIRRLLCDAGINRGGHRGALVDPRLRHHHPHRGGQPVGRHGAARPPQPPPRL